MVDVVTLLRERDPAADAPPVADSAAIRERAMRQPRDARPAPPRSPGKRRFAVIIALALVALGGTAVADRLLTASEVFSSPDAAGQGDMNAPVHPIAGSERVVQSVQVPGIGRVELWAAKGSSATGACLGLRFPDGTWGAGKDNPNVGGNGPSCFTERDDPLFKGILVPTGIDSFETNTNTPSFQRIVYGWINSDVPRTAVRMADLVTGASTPVIEGRYFAYVEPRADPQTDDRQLVAYDAAGKIVTGERPAGDPNQTALGSG
jgi:hypothetical protein